MGLFGGNFTKEGPGVSKEAPEKHRFFLFFELFFRKFTKLIWLNFIYFVTMIPVLLGIYLSFRFDPELVSALAEGATEQVAHLINTQPPIRLSGDVIGLGLLVLSVFIVGPATAGFTYVLRNFQREEHAWVFSDFREQFRKNYKQGLLMGLLDLVVGLLLFIGFNFYRYTMPVMIPGSATLAAVGIWAMVVLAIFFIMMHYYIYLMMVTFELKFRHLLKNAAIFAIAKLPVNLFVSILIGIISFACMLWPMALVLGLPLLYFSLVGYIAVFSVYPSIDRQMLSQAEENCPAVYDETTQDFTDTI